MSEAAAADRAPDNVLEVRELVVEFPLAGSDRVHAVSSVSFDVRRGETLGIVGESGCGKSSTGRAILQLPPPTSGSVRLEGAELVGMGKRGLRTLRPKMQMIFQDPISSLNPRRRVRDIIAEPLDVWGTVSKAERLGRVRQVLGDVGMNPDEALDRWPRQFSGGQCQRISLARALVIEPSLLICDEPVSSLDVNVQAQVMNLLEEIKEARGLSMVFISHDLSVVKHISDRVAVMYLGKLCEIAPSDSLYANRAHPYTAALLAAVPVPDPAVSLQGRHLTGDLPSPVSPPSGCRFRTRCPRATELCAGEEPTLRAIGTDHYVACHFPMGANEEAA